MSPIEFVEQIVHEAVDTARKSLRFVSYAYYTFIKIIATLLLLVLVFLFMWGFGQELLSRGEGIVALIGFGICLVVATTFFWFIFEYRQRYKNKEPLSASGSGAPFLFLINALVIVVVLIWTTINPKYKFQFTPLKIMQDALSAAGRSAAITLSQIVPPARKPPPSPKTPVKEPQTTSTRTDPCAKYPADEIECAANFAQLEKVQQYCSQSKGEAHYLVDFPNTRFYPPSNRADLQANNHWIKVAEDICPGGARIALYHAKVFEAFYTPYMLTPQGNCYADFPQGVFATEQKKVNGQMVTHDAPFQIPQDAARLSFYSRRVGKRSYVKVTCR